MSAPYNRGVEETQTGTEITAPEHLEHRPAFARALDRALAVQRPVVLAHIRSVRLRHPGRHRIR